MEADGKPLRLGVLSTARINRSLFRAARDLTDIIDITHVASRDPEHARAYADRHGIRAPCGSYEELLASPVDAVYVPLPASMHGEWTMRALQAGKHVLCEKPFAANEEEAREMVTCARQAGLILMEAMHYRYHPLVERFYAAAHDEIGPLRYVDARFQWPVEDLSDIRGQYELGGGATMDMGCYAVHWLRSSVGEEPVVESANAVVAEHDPRVDIRLEASLAFPCGVSGRYIASMEVETTPAFFLRADGEHGSVTADPFINPQSIVVESPSGTIEHRMPDAQTTFWYQLNAFFQSVLSGEEPMTAGEDSVANMRVIDALYRQAGLPLRVRLPASA